MREWEYEIYRALLSLSDLSLVHSARHGDCGGRRMLRITVCVLVVGPSTKRASALREGKHRDVRVRAVPVQALQSAAAGRSVHLLTSAGLRDPSR